MISGFVPASEGGGGGGGVPPFEVTEYATKTPTQIAWILLGALEGVGWARVADSDGTTYSATGEQLTGDGSGAHGLGNADAWYMVESPGGQQVVVHRAAEDTWEYLCFPNGDASGGNATTIPTSGTSTLGIGGGFTVFPLPNSTARIGIQAEAPRAWYVSISGGGILEYRPAPTAPHTGFIYTDLREGFGFTTFASVPYGPDANSCEYVVGYL